MPTSAKTAAERVAVAMSGGTRRRWLLAVAITETAFLFAAALASVGYDINRMPESSHFITDLARGEEP